MPLSCKEARRLAHDAAYFDKKHGDATRRQARERDAMITGVLEIAIK